jgi:G2/mitotic-specific cyclin 3/4
MSALNATFLPTSKGLNANPVRRAAFADISNKGNATNGQDDSNGKGKLSQLDVKPVKPLSSNLSHINLQPLQHIDHNVNKAKPFLRPAQRPLSIATQKALPAEPVNSHIAASYFPESLENLQPRKTLIKRHTTIFRETPPVVNNPLILSELKPFNNNSTQAAAHFVETIPEPEVVAPLHEQQLPPLPSDEPILEPALSVPPTIPSTEVSALTYVEINPAQIPLPESVEPIVGETFVEPELYLPALESQVPDSLAAFIHEDPLVKPATVDVAPLKQTVVDVEEYWDEEEEEFFDAEGCITARSIRSVGGDNTTGGVSMVLNPRMSVRVERELAAAKVWVEENISPEDVEEEAWDTTMVAEYGDEIFTYMRDLEVCTIPDSGGCSVSNLSRIV